MRTTYIDKIIVRIAKALYIDVGQSINYVGGISEYLEGEEFWKS